MVMHIDLWKAESSSSHFIIFWIHQYSYYCQIHQSSEIHSWWKVMGKVLCTSQYYFFLVLDLFTWQIVILHERTKFITVLEWPSSALRKQNQILIIRECSLIYRHQPIYGTCMMTKVMKKSQYQIIYLVFWTYLFFVSILWNKSEEHINTDYSVTGWMLCVILHIREDFSKNRQNKHHIWVNNVIKTFFSG